MPSAATVAPTTVGARSEVDTPVTALSPVRATLRSRKSNAVRWGHDTTEVDRDMAAEKLAEFIARTLALAPPLRPEQIDRLRSLFPPVPVQCRPEGRTGRKSTSSAA